MRPMAIRVIVGATLLAAPFAVTPLALRLSQVVNQHEEIPSPAGWVPFSAYGAIENPQRGMHLVGRHYRSSDGSERWEQGAPDVKYISIRNVPEATFYEWHSRSPDKWTAYPMQLPYGEWRPTRFAVGRAGLTGVESTIEGIRVLQQIDASGREAWLAPSLNFFTVKVTKSVVLGTLQTFSNFDLNEPPAHLFVPPPDATVVHSSTPRGIVWTP